MASDRKTILVTVIGTVIATNLVLAVVLPCRFGGVEAKLERARRGCSR